MAVIDIAIRELYCLIFSFAKWPDTFTPSITEENDENDKNNQTKIKYDFFLRHTLFYRETDAKFLNVWHQFSVSGITMWSSFIIPKINVKRNKNCQHHNSNY